MTVNRDETLEGDEATVRAQTLGTKRQLLQRKLVDTEGAGCRWWSAGLQLVHSLESSSGCTS